jgi:hypothetical protein
VLGLNELTGEEREERRERREEGNKMRARLS